MDGPDGDAAGNAFILKPSECDPSSSMAGLPDGVFQIPHGDEETFYGLLTHADVDCISFLGSTPIAQYV